MYFNRITYRVQLKYRNNKDDYDDNNNNNNNNNNTQFFTISVFMHIVTKPIQAQRASCSPAIIFNTYNVDAMCFCVKINICEDIISTSDFKTLISFSHIV